MFAHVCPWWGGYFIDNRFRRLFHKPELILAPFVRPGMETFDFGCGMGLFSLAMAEIVGEEGRVVAADLQSKMLDAVNRRAEAKGVAEIVATHLCQKESLNLEGAFDFILAFYAAHEAPDSARLFDEFASLLKPDGRLLLVEPRGHVTGRAFQSQLDEAKRVGLHPIERPNVRLSRAALLGRVEVD